MRDIFDEAIGASPPTRIDIDTVITRRRRITRLRSAGAATATAVAAVMAAAVVVSLSGGGKAQQSLGGAGHPSAAVSATPSAAPLPSRSPETAQQTTQRLTTTVKDRLTALLPGVQLADRRTKASEVRVYPRDAALGGYLSSLRVTTGAGSGTFNLVSARRPKA